MFYSIAADVIQMPPFESFQDANCYYGTLAHESSSVHRRGSRTTCSRIYQPQSHVPDDTNKPNTAQKSRMNRTMNLSMAKV